MGYFRQVRREPDPARPTDGTESWQNMASKLLSVDHLSASADETPILHDIDLTIDKGACHVLMGPNGAGKSTLGHVIMGDPAYSVTRGRIVLEGQDITELPCDKRALMGIFMSFQAPVEVPGVPLYSFLRTITQARPELKTTARRFRSKVTGLAEELDMDPSYLTRELNVGFSGGERKKVEMLQLLLLEPKLAILDETDSGLDVDALGVVSRGIQAYRERCDGSLIVITHNTRILDRLAVDEVDVMVHGSIVDRGDASLISTIDEEGFEGYESESKGGLSDHGE